MRDKICTLLGIESGEESMVSMLLTQSIFLGIFIGAFDITAYSLFLPTFNEKIMARGFIVSGIAGILLTYLYSRIQTRVRFKTFSFINLLVVTVLTLSLWSALIISPVKWIIFLVFIMLGPLNLIVLQGFWEVTERLFTMEQGKRLLRLADAGLIIGTIIISYLIPVLLSFKFQLHNILLVSAASVFIAAIIQIVIGNEFSLTGANKVKHKGETEKNSSVFKSLSEDPYFRIIGIFGVLSVLSAFFILYSFMAVTREQYPVAENMARFLGLFSGDMMIFVLVIKLFVFKYILYNYGLRTCLIITPLVIAAISALAVLIGLMMGYTPEASVGFIIFFILLAAGRVISKSLKDSVESSALKIIYLSIDKKIKIEIRPGIAGMITQIGVLFSGLILTALGLFSFIKLIHFSLALFVITLTWLYVSFRLFLEYRKTIITSIEKDDWNVSEDEISKEMDSLKNRFSAYLAFRKDYFRLILGNYSNLKKINNPWYFENIISWADSKRDISLIPVLKKAATNTSLDESARQRSDEVAGILQDQSSSKLVDEKIAEAIKSLAGTRKPQTTEILRLLRDNSIESKRLAIYMIGKFGLSDLLSEVCQCLSIPGLAIDATEVLRTFGSEIEDELVRFYLIKSGNTSISKAILRLFGKTCSKETLGFLFSRLWSNSRQLKEIAVKCLINCNFMPTDDEKQRLNQLSSELIDIIAWYLSAKISFERDKDNFLLEKINREIERWNKFLFSILSITYKSGSIAKILENVNKGTVESICYALDIADIVVSDSLKPKLISLLAVVPDEVKVRNLYQYYPGDIPARKRLLEDIINRDYNLISLWTKACTLRSIPSIEYDDLAESVKALLFSPEEIIQEEAANLISRSDTELYISVSERIPDQIKQRLDKIINGTTNARELLFEKVQFLSSHFESIGEDQLLPLAVEMLYANNINAVSPGFSEGCIIWKLSGNNENTEVQVLYNGDADRLAEKYKMEENPAFYFVPLAAVEQYHFQFPEKSYEILKYIDECEEKHELPWMNLRLNK